MKKTVKRTHTQNKHKQQSAITDLRKIVPVKQAAALGLLALAYNEVEATIDRLFFVSTALADDVQFETSTRIPYDGKITILKVGAKPFLEEKDWDRLANALGDGGFGFLKTYRDGVIHARHLNASASVGVKVDRQAKIFDFLIRQDALEKAYEIAVALRNELNEAASFLYAARTLTLFAGDDPKREQPEAEMKACQTRFRGYHTARQALPPIPEFPEEPELLQADFQLLKAQQLAAMGWFGPHDGDFAALYQQRAMRAATMGSMPHTLMMEELQKQKKE